MLTGSIGSNDGCEVCERAELVCAGVRFEVVKGEVGNHTHSDSGQRLGRPLASQLKGPRISQCAGVAANAEVTGELIGEVDVMVKERLLDGL